CAQELVGGCGPVTGTSADRRAPTSNPQLNRMECAHVVSMSRSKGDDVVSARVAEHPTCDRFEGARSQHGRPRGPVGKHTKPRPIRRVVWRGTITGPRRLARPERLRIDDVDRYAAAVRRANDGVDRRERLVAAPPRRAGEAFADEYHGLAARVQATEM